MWDGQVWCGLGVEIGGEVRALALHGDSLIVATWGDQTFNGLDMNNLAAYTGTLDGDICGTSTSVDEQLREHGELAFTLHPIPTTGLLHVELHGLRPRELFVSDALGREVLRQHLPGTWHTTLGYECPWPRGLPCNGVGCRGYAAYTTGAAGVRRRYSATQREAQLHGNVIPSIAQAVRAQAVERAHTNANETGTEQVVQLQSGLIVAIIKSRKGVATVVLR